MITLATASGLTVITAASREKYLGDVPPPAGSVL
jgi:hypothetical protein